MFPEQANLQAHYTPKDDEGKMKDIGDSESYAQQNAYDSEPKAACVSVINNKAECRAQCGNQSSGVR